MQKIILSLLAYLARAIIMRHKPYVIGVTGSIGKTTLTTYISEYLRLIYGESAVDVSPYHYNGEYGLPLTIIGAKTGGKNPLLWIIAFTKGIVTYLKRSYPKYIILEYGIDHSGEMEYLVSIVKPDIAVLSVVVPTHMEQFGSFERYRRAKLLLVESAKSYSIVHESLRTFCP
jgi:UDP-N-acetylmuramoyl-tripeptide--D-alanyl-D-alanine ligase